MDIASLAGIILGAVMFVFGVFSNGGFEALKNMVLSGFPGLSLTRKVLSLLLWHRL